MLCHLLGTLFNIFIIAVPTEIDVKCPRLMFGHGSMQSGRKRRHHGQGANVAYYGWLSIYINVRMSRDCLLLRVCVCVCQIIASFSSFWAAVTLCTFKALSI